MAYGFEELAADFGKVIDMAGEQASKAFEYSRVQFDKANAMAKLNGKYTELGKMYYDSLQTGVEKYAELRALADEITALKKQVEKQPSGVNLKKERFCRFCGVKCEPEYAFCPKCGEPV